MLFPCRKHLSGVHQSRPPGVVWFGNLRDYPGNVRILPAVRNPRGRHRLMNMGLGTANYRYRKWLCPNSHIVAASCRSCTSHFVFLSVVGLRTSDPGEVVVCQFSHPMVCGYPV